MGLSDVFQRQAVRDHRGEVACRQPFEMATICLRYTAHKLFPIHLTRRGILQIAFRKQLTALC